MEVGRLVEEPDEVLESIRDVDASRNVGGSSGGGSRSMAHGSRAPADGDSSQQTGDSEHARLGTAREAMQLGWGRRCF